MFAELVIMPSVQPQWSGREPDCITNVKGGIKHPIPDRMTGLDVGMSKFDGIWKWVGVRRAKG